MAGHRRRAYTRAVRFLHTSDIHLGKTWSGSPASAERSRDFAVVLSSILTRAMEENVDAVVIAGDLFHDAEVQPRVFAEAVATFAPLRDAGIPVLIVEGNHDWIHRRDRRSWIEALAEMGYVTLLRPESDLDGALTFPEWSPETRSGGRIDLGGVTFFGVGYFGAYAGTQVPRIVDAAFEAAPSSRRALLFHVGVRTYSPNEVGCMSIEEALPLADAFGYVALGHGHKPYVIERDGVPFAFNPGSPECVNFGEETYRPKGANLVTWDDGCAPIIEHIPTSPRPMFNVRVDATGAAHPDDAAGRIASALATSIAATDAVDDRRPVVRVRVGGRVGFRPIELTRERIGAAVSESVLPLHVEVDNTLQLARADRSSDSAAELVDVEQSVVTELWAEQSAWAGQAGAMALITVDLKRRLLDGSADAAELFEFFHRALHDNSSVESE